MKAVRLALLRLDCAAVLIVLDGDTDCPGELGPRLQDWAAAVAREIPCAVVLAHREYEAWFLAALESLRGQRGIRADAASAEDPEGPQDAKGVVDTCMGPTRAYHPRVDQPALTALFDMAHAHRRSRSFRRMVRAVGQLVSRAGVPLAEWPPAHWLMCGGII